MRIPRGGRPEFNMPEKSPGEIENVSFVSQDGSRYQVQGEKSPGINYKPGSFCFVTVSRGMLIAQAFKATWAAYLELGKAGHEIDYNPIILLNHRVDQARRLATIEAMGRGVEYMCMVDDDIEVESQDSFLRLSLILKEHPGAFAAIGHVPNKHQAFVKPYQAPDNMIKTGNSISLCGFALSIIRLPMFWKISKDPADWWHSSCKVTGRGEDSNMSRAANTHGCKIYDDIEVWGRHWELATYRGVMPGHDVVADVEYGRSHGFRVYSRSGIEER